MKLTRMVYETRREKAVDLFIGLVGLIVVNILLLVLLGLFFGLFGLSLHDNGRNQTVRAVLAFLYYSPFVLVNIGGLVIAARTRIWILWGALCALGIVGLYRLWVFVD